MKRNKILKITGIVLLVIFLGIQFIPSPKNDGVRGGENAISTLIHTPENIENILATSCYDCHSNKTNYPWYNLIQPVRYWLNDHVSEGKRKLNFDEFATYKIKRQLHKLDEVVETVESNFMPLSSYTIVHKDAILNEEQKSALIDWAKNAKVQIEMSAPSDSL